VRRWLTVRRMMTLSGLGLLLATLVNQSSSRPAVELGASMVGVSCFVWFLVIALRLGRMRFVIGVLHGLTFDTLLRGLSGTLDLTWQARPGPSLITMLLGIIGSLLLWQVLTREDHLDNRDAEGWSALFGIGPWLFLNLLILQNEGWVATGAGWQNDRALLLITAGNVAAIWLASIVFGYQPRRWWTAVYIGSVAAAAFSSGFVFLVFVTVALIGGGYYLALIVAPVESRTGSTIPALEIGMLLMSSLTIVYYAGFVVQRLPESRPVLGLALLLLMASALVAQRLAKPLPTAPDDQSRLVVSRPARAWLAVPVLVAGIFPVVNGASEPRLVGDGVVRLMTYNIHLAANTTGQLDPAGIVAVVRDVDIVAFQEISRGWLIGGSTDLVTWLSEELSMPYVTFFPTTGDPLWGNAIMSKYPIVGESTGTLPMEDARPQRGYLAAQIDLGDSEDLLVITTHLADRDARGNPDPSGLHVLQVGAILAAWGGRPDTILVGDMNARPHTPEMDLVLAAGLVDAWTNGDGEGFTAPSTGPNKRVDWMFHTSDLVVESVATIDTHASDHRPVVATITRTP
ncbi:MAG: endonuclease/exonuclease/phosphatase family protein, partial [Acidimicrobiia bacterium]|nr:endonuclease/exonuclease/phosphatase family protein [Acidimicrobiia bacterium]